MTDDKLDEKDQELMDSLAKAERSRQTRALATGGLIAGLLVTLGILAVLFSDVFFQPELDIAGGEEDVLAETNDPQCRGFIEKVTKIEADYRALETDVESLMGTDDPEKLKSLRSSIGELRARIDRQEKASADANLRYDESRGELDAWFGYIDNELSLVQDLVSWRLEEIGAADPVAPKEEAAEGADAGTPMAEADGDAGAAEVVHVAEKPDATPTGAARVRASKKTPKELHEGSMLAVHEAFQSFRVWHTGSLHPCGKAEEGEEPWAPAGAAPAKKEKG